MRRVRRVREEWEERLRVIERGTRRRYPRGGYYRNDIRRTDHETDAYQLGSRKVPAPDASTKWRLNTVYVATNGDTVWWDAITSELRADGWEVRGSADMDFMRDIDRVHDGPSRLTQVEREERFIHDAQGKEGEVAGSLDRWVDEGEMRARNRWESERVVGLAVDMEIAARAEVFIGNGVSDQFRWLRVHACRVLFILFEEMVSMGFVSTFYVGLFCVRIATSFPLFVFMPTHHTIADNSTHPVVLIHIKRQPAPYGARRPARVDPVLVTTPFTIML
jgi:hypothetical protein